MLRRAVKRQKNERSNADNESELSKTAKQHKIVRTALGGARPLQREEKVLEKLVLGAEDELLESLEKKSVEKKRKKTRSRDEFAKPKPAWEDEEDEIDRISTVEAPNQKKKQKKDKAEHFTSSKLRNEFEKISGTPSWARLRWERKENSTSDEDSDTEDLLKKTGNYLAESDSLAQGIIQLKRCTDANKEQPSRGKLKSVQFHPSSQVLLTAGMDQTLHLFQVDGKTNAKIQSVFLEQYPIFNAQFSADGREVIMGGKFPSFYYYDMIVGKMVQVPKRAGTEKTENTKRFKVSPDGKLIAFQGGYGNIHLVSTSSKERIHTLKMNGTVESVAFNNDGSRLFSVGDEGEVYVWDMNRRQCIHRFVDEGCIQGTSLAVSTNSQYLAVGSHSGVVNVYDDSYFQSSRPKPLKAIMNLTTPCTSMVFNSQTELLALASDYSDKAVKLVHLPSLTAFSNFPEGQDALRIPLCMDFSTRSGYFAVGNQKGEALLYRVKHYGNY